MIADCRPSLFASGDVLIAWIATHLREPWLTPIMQFFSDFGKTGHILFTVALGYWLWNKRATKYLGYGMFASLILNILIKGYVQECRPPQAFWLEDLHGFSFPSGHAQIAVLVWWGFAYYVKSRSLSLLFFLMGVLIALSRPYLGAHYPHDVIASLLLCLLILYTCLLFDRKDLKPIGSLPLWGQGFVLFILFSTLKWAALDPADLLTRGLSSGFGFWLGCQLESRKCRFQPPREILPLISLMLMGTSGILVLWKGGDWIRNFLSTDLSFTLQYIQYLFLGIWITFGVPLVWQRFNPESLKATPTTQTIH